jgi:hypothetical protein
MKQWNWVNVGCDTVGLLPRSLKVCHTPRENRTNLRGNDVTSAVETQCSDEASWRPTHPTNPALALPTSTDFDTPLSVLNKKQGLVETTD